MVPPQKLIALAAALVLAHAVQLPAQATDVATQADRYLTARMDMGNFSGAVLIGKGDKILLRKGYGYADVEKRIPFTPETQHEVASVSKMFTAMAAMKLRDAGRIKLGDQICRYVHDCPKTWQAITIDQLIHHTSGIPDYEEPLVLGSEKYNAFMTQKDASKKIVENARSLPLDFTPGTKFSYSNTGYILLSGIVERAAGRSFAKYVTDELLKPAGMTSSGVISVSKPTRLANGYTYGELGWEKLVEGVSLTDGHMKRVPDLPLTSPEGDAFLYTTIDDLFRWSKAMDGGKLVSATEVAETFTPQLEGYGAGWFVGTAFNRKRVRHNGALPGRLTDFVKFPDDSVTIIIFANLDRGRMSSVARDLTAITLGTPWDMPVRGSVVKLTPDQISNLTGDYKMGDGKLLTIRQETLLTAKLEGRYTAGLIPLSASEFYFPLGDGRAVFTLDQSGKATQVNIRYGGEDHIASRATSSSQ